MSNSKTVEWVVNGIEFTTLAKSANGLAEGLVENPRFADVFFFVPSTFEGSELAQLVDEGYLEKVYPSWLGVSPFEQWAFSLRVADKLPKDEEAAECYCCGRFFNWSNDGSQLVETFAGSGPSYACGGTPPEFEPACPACIDGE